ncbi:site-specific DNA-methyltransferase [Cuneatibacter sp. NSJ-177]|uniref:DNA methyltransferase n=1 Tax=Cuneatibacter sp. NSJ-177 TaxID=2931401 RepID=UPI001FD0E6AD|nr:DNA methyltransferase [Cuneatibacter sp. NSJ-177]MCJ7837545.1 site-specific DNA-methyltransferase [Cuneatibacter sp. NSJ-177]
MQETYEQLIFIEGVDTEKKAEYLVENFSADEFCESKARVWLETHFEPLLEVTDKFNRQSVSYQLSKKDILHSWLKYKEGFSADLVNTLLDEMNVPKNGTILDPFFGSGTTGLVCQMRGLNSIGYDIMPISSVSIKAKSSVMDYDIGELENLLREVRNLVVPNNYSKKTEYIKITEDAYPPENEIFIQYISDWRDESDYSEQSKNLLTLCVVNSLERCSYTTKTGQYLGWDYRSPKVIKANKEREASGKKLLPKKVVREVIADAHELITEELEHVITEIKLIQKNNMEANTAHINYVQNTVLKELPLLEDNSINGVITSPPYCNRYDYTRTYALELVYLGLGEQGIKDMRQTLISCTVESKSKVEQLEEYYKSIGEEDRFINIKNIIDNNNVLNEVKNALNKRKDNGDLNNNGVIRMVEGYFTELAFVYAEIYRACVPGSFVAFVNDNVRYGGEVIPVDFLSSLFAEQFGFKVKKVYCLHQKKGNSSQQMAKFGKVSLRKSITIWEKE